MSRTRKGNIRQLFKTVQHGYCVACNYDRTTRPLSWERIVGPSNIRKNWQQYYESALEELDRVKTEENVFLPKALYSAGGKS